MIIASNQVTLVDITDIDSVVTYYTLATSSPSVPTTYPPSSIWTTEEPTYISGNTNSLYTVICTVFSNGTFEYSNVSLSSSYAASKDAYEVAMAAQSTSETTSQYFWHTTDGAHITQKPQSEFVEDEANGGPNLLASANGMLIKNGTTDLASFTSSGAQIGKDNESHAQMDYHSFRLVDKDGYNYFYVSDLRNADGTLTETFDGDGTTTVFNLKYLPTSISTVKIDGVETSGYTSSQEEITFDTAPADLSVISISYYPYNSDRFKGFTFGIRGNQTVGGASIAMGMGTAATNQSSIAIGDLCQSTSDYSLSAGYGNIASGHESCAIGVDNFATGMYGMAIGNHNFARNLNSVAIGKSCDAVGARSFAIGTNVEAYGSDEFAIGDFNRRNHSGVLFVIGNGFEGYGASDAFCVTTDGNVEMAVKNSGSGTVDGDLYNIISSLGWYDDVIEGYYTDPDDIPVEVG